MKKQFVVFAVFILVLLVLIRPVSAQDFAPQVWSNASVVWNVNDRFGWRNTMAFNVLTSKEVSWNEVTLLSTAAYQLTNILEPTAGVYGARTKQGKSLNSYELRPFLGIRLSSNNNKRWLISNLTRFEWRLFIYSDDSNTESFRIRNRTYVVVSLNKKSMVISDKNLFVFGYFEAFFNFGDEVKERFFNQFKYKLGFGYRINKKWGIDLGAIYQDASNNIIEQLPTILTTNFIIEWGVRLVIGPKEEG